MVKGKKRYHINDTVGNISRIIYHERTHLYDVDFANSRNMQNTTPFFAVELNYKLFFPRKNINHGKSGGNIKNDQTFLGIYMF